MKAQKAKNEIKWRPKTLKWKEMKPERPKFNKMKAQKAKMKGNERKWKPKRPKWKEIE